MSRSYGKYKTVGNCCGNNTPYYKLRRRKLKRQIKQSVSKIWAKTHDPVLFDEIYQTPKIAFKDEWDEPTDGSHKLYPNSKDFDRYGRVYKVKNKNRVSK